MDIKQWMQEFLNLMQENFGHRLVFAGLQGSRGRGEGTDESDIDVVVVLDALTMEDLDVYRAAVEDLPDREKLCGFVSGRTELENWDAADLFQFYHDTTPYLGSLDFLLPRIGKEAVCRAVHLGACNIHHAVCHNYLHEREPDILKGCCKSAFFVLQAKHYLETGSYIARKMELLRRLQGMDREVLALLMDGIFGEPLRSQTELLLRWTGDLIRNAGGNF